MTAADQPSTISADAHGPAPFLAAAAPTVIDDALRDAQHEPPDAAGPGPEQALASLMLLQQVHEQLAGWETGLIETAREAGAGWADLARPLGVASRQAAERPCLRGRPGAVGTTGEQRVTAARWGQGHRTRHRHLGRTNAADLRRLAGQITALIHLAPEARSAQAALHAAFGATDAAELIAPLTGTRPYLDAHHTDLVTCLDALDDRLTATAAYDA